MDHNRRVNGAASPNGTASSDASEQRAQDRLSTNPDIPQKAEKRTFIPELPDPEETNRRVVRRGLEPDWPSGYEQYIPVGPNLGLSAGAGETSQDELPPMGKGRR